MKKLILLISLLLISSLVGCASGPTTQTDPGITAGNTLLATKGTIINIHEGFRTPCKTGVVPAAVCHKVDDLTNQAGLAYDAAATSAQVALQTGTTADAAAKKATFEQLLGQLVALALQYSVPATGGN